MHNTSEWRPERPGGRPRQRLTGCRIFTYTAAGSSRRGPTGYFLLAPAASIAAENRVTDRIGACAEHACVPHVSALSTASQTSPGSIPDRTAESTGAARPTSMPRNRPASLQCRWIAIACASVDRVRYRPNSTARAHCVDRLSRMNIRPRVHVQFSEPCNPCTSSCVVPRVGSQRHPILPDAPCYPPHQPPFTDGLADDNANRPRPAFLAALGRLVRGVVEGVLDAAPDAHVSLRASGPAAGTAGTPTAP